MQESITDNSVPFWQTRWFRRSTSMGVRYIIALLLIAFAVFPAIWVISASLNPAKSLISGSLWPKNPGFTNYIQLFNRPIFPFGRWMFNSLKLASISASITIIITCMTGYALSRFRFKGTRPIMTGILVLNVFPAILAMVALYVTFQQLGLYIPGIGLDSHGALILIYVSGAMGINALMVKAYIDAIPLELDEAAWIEGASHWQTYWRIIFPMIIPIVITVGLLAFIAVYGDFVIARVLLKTGDKLTVMAGLYLFRSDRFDVDFGAMTAGAVVAAIPIILLYIPLQKYVISGLTAGSVKE